MFGAHDVLDQCLDGEPCLISSVRPRLDRTPHRLGTWLAMAPKTFLSKASTVKRESQVVSFSFFSKIICQRNDKV